MKRYIVPALACILAATTFTAVRAQNTGGRVTAFTGARVIDGTDKPPIDNATIVVRDDPPHGFKGPVMEPAPTGDDALRMWDAIVDLSRMPGFYEITRPHRIAPVRPR